MTTINRPFGGSAGSRPGRLSGVLDWLADAFSGPMVAGIGQDYLNPPADLSPEEAEAYLDLLASRAESAGLVRESARKAGVSPAVVLGGPSSPAGPGNNRNRRRALAKLILSLRDRMARTARRLVDGAVSLVSWLAGFKRDISVGHGAAAMIAEGATAPNRSIFARTAKVVAFHWGKARNFAGQIATGAHVLGKATIARAAMYADAAWATFMNAQVDVAKLQGYAFAKRILGASEDHCHNSRWRHGCVELAARGWVAIDEVAPIGSATCLSRCHCRYQFKH